MAEPAAGPPRRPTIRDVAERAGVSKSLVSLVMRGEPGASADTRRRILDVAEQLGYHPDSRARLLRSGRSRLLGVVFGIQHAFHGDLVTALYTAAGQTGYELALSAVTPDRRISHGKSEPSAGRETRPEASRSGRRDSAIRRSSGTSPERCR